MSIDNQKLKRSGLKAGAWNFSTTIISQLRNFIVSLILARLLSPADFGLLGMATVFVGVVETFVDFGFGASIVQAKRITRQQMSTVFYINLIMGLIFAVTMFFSSGIIASFFHEERLNAIVKVLSAKFIVKALQIMPEVQFKRALNYHDPFKISIISGIISGILGIMFAFLDYGVWALVYSQIIGWGISLVLQYWKTKWYPMPYFNIHEIKDLWKFGYKFSLSVMIDQVFNKLNTILIGRFYSASLLGLYYRASSLNRLVIQYSFSSFSNILFPTFCKYQDDLIMLRHNVLRVVQVVSFLTFLFSGLMIICAGDLINILYGSKWAGAVDFFKILGLFSITQTIPSILVNALMSVGRTDVNLKIEIIKKTLYVFAIPIGLHYGVYGYVWAISISALITMPLNMWSLKYIQLSMSKQFTAIFNYLIPFAILVVLDMTFSNYMDIENVWVSLLIKSSLYFTTYISWNLILKNAGIYATISLIRPILTPALSRIRFFK